MRLTPLTLLALSLLSLPALAGEQRLALPVGTSTTLAMPTTVKKVSVEDPTLVDVTTSGRKVVLVARHTGVTHATIRTAEGEHTVRIYVAADRHALPY